MTRQLPKLPTKRSRYSDSLRAGRCGDGIPVASRFSLLVQTGSEALSASCAMDTGSFLGVNRPGRGDDHAPPSGAEVKERVELYLWTFVACYRMNFYLYLYFTVMSYVL